MLFRSLPQARSFALLPYDRAFPLRSGRDNELIEDAQTSATDTSNFDSEFTSEQPTLTHVHSTLSAQDQGEFAGFSCVPPPFLFVRGC